MNAAGCDKFELVFMVKIFEFFMLIGRRSASTIAPAHVRDGQERPWLARRPAARLCKRT
jgi:hypothetical protein